MQPRILVIGYGNPHRQDDRAGHELARAVAEWAAAESLDNVHVRTDYQLDLEMVDDIATAAFVLFFDAHAAEYSDTVAVTPVAPEPARGFTTHALTAGNLLALTSQLYGVDVPGCVISVPGYTFDMEYALSPETAAALDAAFVRARAMIMRACQDPATAIAAQSE